MSTVGMSVGNTLRIHRRNGPWMGMTGITNCWHDGMRTLRTFVYCWAGIDGCVAPFTDRYRSSSVYTGRFQRHTNHLYRAALRVGQRVYTNTKTDHKFIIELKSSILKV